MDSQLWSRSADKWAYILMLRDQRVTLLKVTGMALTLKWKIKEVLEGLQAGQEPSEVGVKWVRTLDAPAISKAELNDDNDCLTLYGDDGSDKLEFSTDDSEADEILKTILARTGRTFEPSQEGVGVIEALIQPVIVGAIVGVATWASYMTAGQIAAGKDMEAQGFRRRGLKRILFSISEFLGTEGSIAVGSLLLVLVFAWCVNRIVHRPERTVWLPLKS